MENCYSTSEEPLKWPYDDEQLDELEYLIWENNNLHKQIDKNSKIVWDLLDLVDKKDNEISELKKEIQGLRCNILLLKAMLSDFYDKKD